MFPTLCALPGNLGSAHCHSAGKCEARRNRLLSSVSIPSLHLSVVAALQYVLHTFSLELVTPTSLSVLPLAVHLLFRFRCPSAADVPSLLYGIQ